MGVVQLTILGGGGFRVPLVYEAVAQGAADVEIDRLVLFDEDAERLAAISAVIAELGASYPDGPEVVVASSLGSAVDGADFVFSAIRVGGTAGRVVDERVALDLGLLGQETIGPGGLAYAMRTIPVATRIAATVAERAPDAWVINFTNPAGIVTEAMARVLGDRVVGICDTPIGLVQRVARVIGSSEDDLDVDYLGLNHLGWLRAVRVAGVDRLPDVLADDVALTQIEEARVLGVDLVRSMGALPNEYLWYYLHTDEAVRRITAAEQTRGQFLAEQQAAFYAAGDAPGAAERWRAVLAEREATYMSESRDDERRAEDVAGGGYQGVALNLMAGLATGRASRMILDVRNRGLVPQVPDDLVLEVMCEVDGDGVRPLPVEPPTLDQLGWMARLRASERFALDASLTGDARLALRAFAEHPLVDSLELGAALFDGYRAQHPELAAIFG